ncbi:hypothetical protein SAMN05720766_10970 [Fibrobacter sp. UWH9]|uniref:hypothetical protein n=1 Tax=Fibrobacter sp. UWH9 TaxID=1896213 RepID=UPI0009154A34|nr:hypothetical protein [Fibrobacter sp. UWH9]SHH25542.1 hypothetical protein SAMN05720766_10970 [Fibrobacter sp. UWH9]
MNKKDFIKAFLAGCFSMSLAPSDISIPEIPEVSPVKSLNSKPIWEGVAECFNDAGVLMKKSAKQLTNA